MNQSSRGAWEKYIEISLQSLKVSLLKKLVRIISPNSVDRSWSIYLSKTEFMVGLYICHVNIIVTVTSYTSGSSDMM